MHRKITTGSLDNLNRTHGRNMRNENRGSKMDRPLESFGAVQACGHALSQIAEGGFTVEATTDFDAVPDVIADMGKPHLTPLLSPNNHDFTSSTSFWLILKDPQGKAVGCIGARLEDMQEGEIESYWRRTFQRHYPDAGFFDVTLSGSAQNFLTGRLAYIGDLYIEPSPSGGLGRQGVKRLASMLHLAHALVALEWNVDAAYSFISAKDALRGAANHYGYTVQLPMQKNWHGKPPPKRYDDEWLVILPAIDRAATFRQLLSSS